jgi:cystathionine gamma-synthase
MDKLAAETLVVRLGRDDPLPDGPLVTPVVLASTYHAGGPVAYGRGGNPTWTALEEVVGALEGGRALAFASGMAAISAVLEGLPVGAPVVLPAGAYQGTRTLLGDRAKLGRFEPRPVDPTDTRAALDACEGAALLWLESPTNPLLDVLDLAALCAGARERGARVAVDNTVATPLLQRPLDLGADVVVHSATKFLSGHADVLMGVAVTRDDAVHQGLLERRTLFGAVPGPLEAFLALRGLRTLPLRLERGQASAGVLAERLEEHPAVAGVRYPGLPSHPGHDLARRQMRGFGAMLSFEVDGDAATADRVCDGVRVVTHATSLGGIETLMERRNRWPAEAATPPTLLRLSVGCEHVDDLWRDLDRALTRARLAAPAR